MTITCIIVSSVDGKTTQGKNPSIYHWSSKEDQEYFFSLLDKHNLLIMGRKTYTHAKELMQHKKGKLRVVVTKSPEKFAKEKLPGMLEFTHENPQILIKRLEKQGYKDALLLGGATTNTLFATSGLIDELWITVEPYVFGTGTGLFANIPLNLNLKLLSVNKLNPKGTLLLKYTVMR